VATAHVKGSALELAVHAIEAAIIRTFPAYNDKTFHIENRKLIVAEGVKHEIDIWVNVELGAGYDATFIFECRNWQDKISKNDIIIFAEKIRAAGAQKGYFVARSFTKYAIAQARREPRIALLKVKDLPADRIPIPLGFHGISVEGTTAAIRVNLRRPGAATSEAIPVDPKTALLVIDGQAQDCHKYIDDWLMAEANARTDKFPSTHATEGIHDLEFESTREFARGRATLDKDEIISMSLRGSVKVRVVQAKIVSHFEVESRGRALTVSVSLAGATLHASFAEIPREMPPTP